MTTPDAMNGNPNGAKPVTNGKPKNDPATANPATMDSGQLQNSIDFILDIPLEITVVLGQTRMVVNDLLKLGQGSIVELSKQAGDTLDVLANQRLIARGEVVAVDEKYGIRITEIVSPTERIEKLR